MFLEPKKRIVLLSTHTWLRTKKININNLVLSGDLASNKYICKLKRFSNLGLDARKPVFRGLQTTKGQTSLRSLISAFVLRSLKSIITRLGTSEISTF